MGWVGGGGEREGEGEKKKTLLVFKLSMLCFKFTFFWVFFGFFWFFCVLDFFSPSPMPVVRYLKSDLLVAA